MAKAATKLARAAKSTSGTLCKHLRDNESDSALEGYCGDCRLRECKEKFHLGIFICNYCERVVCANCEGGTDFDGCDECWNEECNDDE